MIACPLGVGILVATASILLIYGQVHGITLAFGMTLAGVAVDYPIHILTGLGPSHQENLPKIKKIWRTLRLGVFSTIIAYAAFLISGFRGLQQLGLFTIIGLLAAAYFSRWVLPVIASWCRHCKPGLSSVHNLLEGIGRKASTLYWLVALILAGALISLSLTDKPILHLNVDSLSPINEQRRAEGKMLRSDLGFWYGGNMMIVNGSDREDVLQYSEDLQPYLDELVQQGELDGYDMAAHFLPSLRHQALQKERAADVDRIRDDLVQVLSELPFRPNVFDPFLEDLTTLQEQPLIDAARLEAVAGWKEAKPTAV